MLHLLQDVLSQRRGEGHRAVTSVACTQYTAQQPLWLSYGVIPWMDSTAKLHHEDCRTVQAVLVLAHTKHGLVDANGKLGQVLVSSVVIQGSGHDVLLPLELVLLHLLLVQQDALGKVVRGPDVGEVGPQVLGLGTTAHQKEEGKHSNRTT